jgi:hypothetical protein
VDPKLGVTARAHQAPDDRFDPRTRRGSGRQLPLESLERVAVALDFDLHTAAAVRHESVKVQPGGQPIDEGTETHALDHAPDVNGATLEHRHDSAHDISRARL